MKTEGICRVIICTFFIMFLLAGFPVFSTGGIDSMNVYAADKQEELQEYYVYRLEDGQLKYWLDLSGDEMKLHCMFMSGDPEYYERIYTFDADSAESSGRTVLLKKVTDDRGNDISDFFVMLSFTFVNDHAVMSVVRDEKTLAGGSSDNLLTGSYTMTPGKPDDAPDHSGSTGSSSKGALKIVEGLLTAEASADQRRRAENIRSICMRSLMTGTELPTRRLPPGILWTPTALEQMISMVRQWILRNNPVGGAVMDLSRFDGKHVRITDKWGQTFTGMAEYGNYNFLECEYGGDEDGIFIEDYLIYNSQIISIEEIEVHGTVELWTDRLILRRYRPEDAEPLYQYLGTDPAMYAYSGWNPYATLEMAAETVRRFIDSYEDDHAYSWVMDVDDVVVGTIGAYDYKGDRIEVGFSVVKGWQGRGFATAALRKVLEYLTETEDIPCVTAWCAAENAGSRRVLEKSGMKLINTAKDGLVVGGKVYDRMTYEYRRELVPRLK